MRNLKMKKTKLSFLIIILCSGLELFAQQETILFGQQKAINNLSSDNGLSAKDLDNYLKKRYNKPLYQLTQSEGADIISGFQDGSLSKNSILDYIRPQGSVVQNFQQNSQQSAAQNKDLIAASVLEVGMKKRFHFKDGSISEGEITGVNDNLITLKTESGEFKIPKDEFLAETAEITNKKGEKFVGHVLKETEEEFSIRTQYGDAVIHKRNIEKIFKVNVIKINTINNKPKSKIVRGKLGKKSGFKKAVVTLKKGQSIDLATGV